MIQLKPNRNRAISTLVGGYVSILKTACIIVSTIPRGCSSTLPYPTRCLISYVFHCVAKLKGKDFVRGPGLMPSYVALGFTFDFASRFIAALERVCSLAASAPTVAIWYVRAFSAPSLFMSPYHSFALFTPWEPAAFSPMVLHKTDWFTSDQFRFGVALPCEIRFLPTATPAKSIRNENVLFPPHSILVRGFRYTVHAALTSWWSVVPVGLVARDRDFHCSDYTAKGAYLSTFMCSQD